MTELYDGRTNKCELCKLSRAIISENGYHRICCLSEKEARKCTLNDYSRFFDVFQIAVQKWT